ncbi:MAG: rod shape-determining protein MreC [Candidatus Moranbacteria bacterium RIFCSPHIGHO2_01_FULL_54_31]|nr:MAG: rod shape-determining protein MreC [Candidatus Moranbacteria bacterium RIFCSPHIGHO2_01_FULL_54_31]
MAVRRKFTQTKLFRALVIFGVLWVIVAFGPEWLLAPVRTSVMTVAWPLQKIFSVAAFESADTFRFFTSIGELKGENERLEKERLHLLVENAQFSDVSKENDELRRELGLLPRDQFALKAAAVLGRDVSGLGNWLTIDQGSLQGIRKGMPVIVDKGVLIGKVEEVFPASAHVMLLSNPDSLISGIALDTEAKGIVKGEYGLGLLFDMVLQSDTLKASDTVVTSGLGGDMPTGLLIGTLQETRFSSDRLFQQASIVSPARFDRVRYVFVITDTL